MAKFLRHALTSVSFLGLFFSLSSAARAGTIDPFTTAFSGDPLWVGTNSSGSSQTKITSTTDTRLAELSSPMTTNYVQASINTTDKKLVYTTTGNQAGSGNLVLNYGYSTPLNLNLTADGSNRFQISIATSNLGANRLPVTINVFCFASDGVTVQSPPAKTYNLVTGSNLIRFTDFPNCNFQKVKQIAYTFNAASLNRLSYTLNPLRTVYSAY